jgi:hypothetical protein
MVEPPAEGEENTDMRLTVVMPEKQPVGVGAREELEAGTEVIDEPGGALDKPATEDPPAES